MYMDFLRKETSLELGQDMFRAGPRVEYLN